MKFEDFKKLKNEISEKTFFNNYKGFSKISNIISYLGNAFSILFAYFFINEIISSTVINPSPIINTIIVIVSIVILMMLELIKRFVFDKFSQSIIKDKYSFKNNESIILLFISICLIATSFYFSLSGAHKYADRKDDIKQTADVQVVAYSDSLNKKYDNKITDLESQNKVLFETNQGYETRLTILGNQYSDNTLTPADLRKIKNEMTQIRKDKDINSTQIEKNDGKVKEIKSEKDKEVAKFESKQTENTSKKIEDTSKNPFIFLVFSTVIEFLILFGIWFINYYKIRSIEDYERLINKDPKYKTFYNWSEFINLIYKSDTRIGDVLPFKVELMKILKSNNLDLGTKELDDMIKVLTHIGVLKPKGNKKAISVSKEDAFEMVKGHLKVD